VAPRMSSSLAVPERQNGARRVHTIHEQRTAFPSPGQEGLGSRRRRPPAVPSPTSPTRPAAKLYNDATRPTKTLVSCQDIAVTNILGAHSPS
jgi:hypothetical protein